MAFKPLNWLELERVTRAMNEELPGTIVERVIVPERLRFPDGFLKDEWCLRLARGSREAYLLVSVRPRRPYLVAGRGKGPKSAAHATRSAFGLQLAKLLEGAKLRSIEAAERERVVTLKFGGQGSGGKSLALELIPSAPDAVLLDGHGVIVARAHGDAADAGKPYRLPSGAGAPASPPVRDLLTGDAYAAGAWLEEELESEAFGLRRERALKEIRSRVKPFARRLEDAHATAKAAHEEPDWRAFADLLKGALGSKPPVETIGTAHVRRVRDYATGATVEIPADPKLSPAEDLERLYRLARRRDRRLSESGERAHALETEIASLKALEEGLAPGAATFEAIERADAALGLAPAGDPGAARGRSERGGWSGKSYVSADGLPIWVGKSRDENMELTFKTAKGNDVWLHVRGRPGAHVVVPLAHGKTAPLETLLDAAVLAVVHSGGGSWGKTEVDYTFRKHVRRIPKSTEVTYTRSKTLLVEPDPRRLARLGGGRAGPGR